MAEAYLNTHKDSGLPINIRQGMTVTSLLHYRMKTIVKKFRAPALGCP